MSKRWWLGFIGIAGLAMGLRFWQLGQIPVSLYWDEIAMVVDVKSILATGHDMFGRTWWQVIYPSYGDFKLPVYIWLATATARVFGLSDWSFRLPSAIAGVLTVIVAGILARELWEERPGKKEKIFANVLQLTAMFIVATAPWSILFSRTGFEGHVGQLCLAISMVCLFRSRRPQQRWLMWCAPFFGALGVYTYFSVRFVWPIVFALGWLWLAWQQRTEIVSLPKKLRFFLPALLQVLLFGALLLPTIRSPLYRDMQAIRFGTDSVLTMEPFALRSNVYREMAGNTRLDRVIFHRRVLQTQALLQNYANLLSVDFLFLSGDPNLRHGTGRHGVLLWVVFPFFLIGLGTLIARRRDLLVVLVGWWLVALLPAAVPYSAPHALRSLNALIPVAIISAIGLTRGVLAANTFQRWVRILGFSIIVLFWLIAIVQFCLVYFTIYPRQSALDWQAGYRPLTMAIAPLLKNNESVYVLPFDDRFYLWVMGYGPFAGNAFGTWQSRQYRFEEAIPHLTIREPLPSQIAERSVWVAGRADRFDSWLADFNTRASVTVEERQVVLDEVGNPTYVVAKVSLRSEKVTQP